MNCVQTDIFELLGLGQREKVITPQEEKQIFEDKISGFSLDEKIIARTHPWIVNHSEDIPRISIYIKPLAETRETIFSQGDYEIWHYSEYCEKWDCTERRYVGYMGYQLAYRIGEEIIAMDFCLEDVWQDEICFPAMCMAYMDLQGNKLPFAIRDNFIENGLGIIHHGEYRLGKVKKDSRLDFASTKSTLPKIIEYIKCTATE